MQFFRIFDNVWPAREPKKQNFRDFINEYNAESTKIKNQRKLAEARKKKGKRVRFDDGEGQGPASDLASDICSKIRSDVGDEIDS
jgi:hypothetical protein